MLKVKCENWEFCEWEFIGRSMKYVRFIVLFLFIDFFLLFFLEISLFVVFICKIFLEIISTEFSLCIVICFEFFSPLISNTLCMFQTHFPYFISFFLRYFWRVQTISDFTRYFSLLSF
jgi:hypothetical protein